MSILVSMCPMCVFISAWHQFSVLAKTMSFASNLASNLTHRYNKSQNMTFTKVYLNICDKQRKMVWWYHFCCAQTRKSISDSKELLQLTFKFLKRICLLRVWGIKTNLLRAGKPHAKIFYGLNVLIKYFIIILLKT